MAKSGTSESEVEEKEGACCQNAQEPVENTTEQSIHVVARPSRTTTPVSILIESLVKNLCMFYEPDDKNAIKIYNYICEKLFEMKLLDESYKMAEFEGMRNQYQRAFHHLVTTARGGEQSIPLQPTWPNNELSKEWSHYFREFDEMEYIAGGGFGQVYRVKHKLDGTEYAIKKIYIRSEGIKSVMNYLSEVKTFASLNHSNIVQYKAAWLELGAPTTTNIMDHDAETYYSYPVASTTENPSNEKKKEHIDDYVYPQFVTDIEKESFQETKEETSTDFEVSFVSTHEYKSKHHSLATSTNGMSIKGSRVKRSSTSEGGNAICTIEEIQNLQVQARPPSKWATLYIQMALCQTTLRQWLEHRNASEISDVALVPINTNVRTPRDQTIVEILRQLLKGLEYIHSKNIVHHDIKPSNVFMEMENGSLLVQLGDFGLACPLQSARHSLAFGTKLYAAPEQLQGKCDPKSDMYSLGIVLFELVSCFNTDMERVRNITELRNGRYKDLTRQYPHFAQIIISLMSKFPGERPDATNLLQRIAVNEADTEVIRDLRNQLQAKDEEILRLKELLKNKGCST